MTGPYNPEYARRYYQKNRDKILAQTKKYSEEHKAERDRKMLVWTKAYRCKLRRQIFEAYGCKCACCGECEEKFLAIDHVNNDGAIERKQYGAGVGLLRKIIREKYPDSYQLLCHNCNVGKHLNGGICPHKSL